MGVPPVMKDADRQALENAEMFRALQEHPGFKLFIEKLQSTQAQAWIELLNETPATVQRTQGFIDGLNFVLGVCRAEISNGQRVMDDYRRAEERAVEASRAAEEFQSQRVGRRSRLGATLD